MKLNYRLLAPVSGSTDEGALYHGFKVQLNVVKIITTTSRIPHHIRLHIKILAGLLNRPAVDA